MSEKIEIFFVDDDVRLRKSIAAELEEHFIHTIEYASNGAECLLKLKSFKPRIILLDLDMPVMDGNQTYDLIKSDFPEIKVIILSIYNDIGLMENYIRRGVKGYVSKNLITENVDILVDAIRTVNKSETFFYNYSKCFLKYSKRETEIISLLNECKTSKEIGKDLGLSEKSVNKFRDQLHKKTKSRNAPEFVKYCIERGLKFLGKK